jgi:hypothetical protein
MSTPEILSMLDEAQNFGIGVYNAWTVEPLLREDLPEILRHAKDLGLTTSLITNGLLLRQRAKELPDLDLLSVSVDGIKSYKELRGIDLQSVLEGIRAAQQAGHEILMNCVISGKNVGELEDLVHLAQSLGCWISFEPMHESFGIEEKVWGSLRIQDIPAYEEALERLIELKRGGGAYHQLRDLPEDDNGPGAQIQLPCRRHHFACGSGRHYRELPRAPRAAGQCSRGTGKGVAVVARSAKGDRPGVRRVPVLRVCGKQPALRVCARGYEALRVDVMQKRLGGLRGDRSRPWGRAATLVFLELEKILFYRFFSSCLRLLPSSLLFLFLSVHRRRARCILFK